MNFFGMLQILFGVVALFFFFAFCAIGLRGIITKRPFLISSRWMFAMMFVCLAPNIVQQFWMPPPGAAGTTGSLNLMLWLSPLMWLCVLVMMWVQMRGYMAFGVTDASFREGLLAALKKLELPHEESLSVMRLPTIGAELQVAVYSRLGPGVVKVKQQKSAPLLGDIAKEMNDYYRSTAVETNMLFCVFYVIVGAFMVVLSGAMLLQLQRMGP